MKRPYIILCFLALVGCSTSKYSSIANPNVDFQNFKTFSCVNCIETTDSKIPRYDNKTNRLTLREAIGNELENRGYVRQKESPDLIVLLEFNVEDFIDSSATSIPNYKYWKSGDNVPYNYKMGTVRVSLVDRAESILIWQGNAEGILDKEPERSKQRINKAMKMIFEEYPIQPINN